LIARDLGWGGDRRRRGWDDPMAITSSSSSGSGTKGGCRLGFVKKTMDEPPVIMSLCRADCDEPQPALTGTQSERPILKSVTTHPQRHPPPPRSTNLTRLFLPFPPLPIIPTLPLPPPHPAHPPQKVKTKGSALLSATARHLDRAVRYLLNSNSQPDRCHC
jgi:hypothetical protein